MGFTINATSESSNPVDLDLTLVPSCKALFKFGGTAANSLKNLITGAVSANTDKVTVSENGMIVNTPFHLDPAVTNMKTYLAVFNSNTFSSTQFANDYIVGQGFNYISLRASNATANSRNLQVFFGASTSYSALSEANVYVGNNICFITVDSTNKIAKLHYFVGGVHKVASMDYSASSTAATEKIEPYIGLNAGNKHYEQAYFNEILSDATIEKYYAVLKKVYARKGIVIS